MSKNVRRNSQTYGLPQIGRFLLVVGAHVMAFWGFSRLQHDVNRNQQRDLQAAPSVEWADMISEAIAFADEKPAKPDKVDLKRKTSPRSNGVYRFVSIDFSRERPLITLKEGKLDDNNVVAPENYIPPHGFNLQSENPDIELREPLPPPPPPKQEEGPHAKKHLATKHAPRHR